MVVPFKAWLASRDPNSSPQMMVVKHSDGSDVKVKKSYKHLSPRAYCMVVDAFAPLDDSDTTR